MKITPTMRVALHSTLDLVLDALDEEPDAPRAPPVKPAKKKPGPARGAGLRTFVPTAPITDLDRERAREIMKRKGI